MAKPRVGAVQYTKKTTGPMAYQNDTYTPAPNKMGIPENSNPPKMGIPENTGTTKPKPVPGKVQIPENSQKPKMSIPENSFGTPTSAADAIFTTRRKNKKKGVTAERLDAVRRRMQSNG